MTLNWMDGYEKQILKMIWRQNLQNLDSLGARNMQFEGRI